MDLSSLGGGGGGGAASSATASNTFGAGGFSEQTLSLIALAVLVVFAIVLATRKK